MRCGSQCRGDFLLLYCTEPRQINFGRHAAVDGMGRSTIGGFFGPLGIFLYWRGRQYATRASTQDVFTASKTHVLYLRAFRTDRSVWGAVFMAFGGQARFSFSK